MLHALDVSFGEDEVVNGGLRLDVCDHSHLLILKEAEKEEEKRNERMKEKVNSPSSPSSLPPLSLSLSLSIFSSPLLSSSLCSFHTS